jgi:hypothetical protein
MLELGEQQDAVEGLEVRLVLVDSTFAGTPEAVVQG